MPKPSLYKQLQAVQVTGNHLPSSPRHWNCSLLRYKGRLWLSFRYHLGSQHGSRCATGMVPLDKNSFQPTMLAQHLNLPAVTGDEHFEDARLFMFRGEVYISFTKMTGYQPGVDYKCTVGYSKLKLKGSTWFVEETWYPQFGRNNGWGKEKNWIFFESNDQLWCIYQDHPTRRVIRIERDKVVETCDTPAAVWQWGEMRGGTPPVPYGDDQMLVIFHSSLSTEERPHYRRYYGAAYLFDAKPPFTIRSISVKPLMAGSEEDGHGFDPRYSAGWKPFIPFPCGLVKDGGDGWLVSLGVNDWQCAVGKIRPEQLEWVSPDGMSRPKRYFTTSNGSLPLKLVGADRTQQWVSWEVPRANGRGAMAPAGYFATDDGRLCEVIEDTPRVREITQSQYELAMKKTGKSLLLV